MFSQFTREQVGGGEGKYKKIEALDCSNLVLIFWLVVPVLQPVVVVRARGSGGRVGIYYEL